MKPKRKSKTKTKGSNCYAIYGKESTYGLSEEIIKDARDKFPILSDRVSRPPKPDHWLNKLDKKLRRLI
jgi:hypothetical protein